MPCNRTLHVEKSNKNNIFKEGEKLFINELRRKKCRNTPHLSVFCGWCFCFKKKKKYIYYINCKRYTQ